MEKHIFLINSPEKYADFQEKRNFCEDTLVKPIVGYMPVETVVMYDANILPENKELWEKFNLIFENHITCEDEWLFSTHLMDFEMQTVWLEQGPITALNIFTKDVNECLGSDSPNPYFKETFAYLDRDDLDATIDDFIGLGDEHIWENTRSCGK